MLFSLHGMPFFLLKSWQILQHSSNAISKIPRRSSDTILSSLDPCPDWLHSGAHTSFVNNSIAAGVGSKLIKGSGSLAFLTAQFESSLPVTNHSLLPFLICKTGTVIVLTSQGCENKLMCAKCLEQSLARSQHIINAISNIIIILKH